MKRFAVPVLVIVALAALAIWGAWQKEPRQAAQAIICADPVAGCSFVHRGMPARLQFSVQPQALKPFTLQLESPILRKASVSFRMADMDMGFNLYQPRPGPDSRWTVSVTLPVCTVSRVDWIAQLNLDDRLYELSFTTH
jgi:hypothetical protein